MSDKNRDLLEIGVIYLVTAILGYSVAEMVTGTLLIKALIADLAMTVWIFVCSLVKRNSSAYDAYWSVIPSFFTVWLFVKTNGYGWQIGHWLAMVMVNVWAWRLTFNWARGWTGWAHEDFRYINLRSKSGALYPLVNFFGIHLFPTAIVFLACLGLFEVAKGGALNHLWMLLGLLVGSVGICLEWIADRQLAAHKASADRKPGELLITGLWGVIRYPNYLGEMLFWWGVGLCGLGAGGNSAWMLAGAIAMVAMFTGATIRMKDQHMAERYPDFVEHAKRVPALWPKLR